MNRRGLLCTLLLCCGALLAACDPDDPCDPGYFEDYGVCLRKAPRVERDAGADAGDAAEPFDESDFGYTCSSDADCGGSAPSCGAPRLPICTVINCLDGASRCPASWTCLDISSWTPDPKIQSVCVNL